MLEYNNNDNDSAEKEDYPDFFDAFDAALRKGTNPGYFEVDELCEIADIYFSEKKIKEGKYTIDYALKMHPENEDLVYEILLLLNDYELWNDLLNLCEKYQDLGQVWSDGHKLTALLHLGMEEDAFQYFRKLKGKYSDDKENLTIVYRAMAEALNEVDLFDASIDVVDEIISIAGEDSELIWLQIQSLLALEDKESVLELASKIQEKNTMNGESWSRLGDVYRDINETDKCIEAYEFAHSLGFENSENLLDLIYAYEKNGYYDKVIQKIDEYTEKYPENGLIYLLAINVCSEIGEWEKGLIFTAKAIKLNPEMETLYLYECKFYLKSGELKKAIKTLEKGIKNTSDSHGDIRKQLDILIKEYPEYES